MRKQRVLSVVLGTALQCAGAAAGASMVTADFSFTGAKGWRASGMVRYDDILSVVSAAGPAWGAFSTGIDYLDVAIFDPAGLVRGSWVQIDGGVVAYNNLRISISTDLGTLTAGSKIEIGNTAVRSAYLGGAEGKTIAIMWNYAIVDSGPGSLAFVPRAEPDPTPVAAPGTAALLLVGVCLVGITSRRGGRRGQDQ